MPVYKAENKTWYVKCSYIDKFGERKYKTKRNFKLRREATRWEDDFLAMVRGDGNIDILPFDTLAEDYLEWYTERRKPSSIRSIQTHLNNHLLPYFKKMDVYKMTSRDVLEFQRHMMQKELSTAYINKTCTNLSALLNHAIKFYNLKVNVASITGNIEITDIIVRNYWTVEQFRNFIAYVDDDMFYALFNLLFYSGIRQGELRALTWKDINFEAGYIDINKTNYKGHIGTPKSKSSIRKVYLPDHTMKALEVYNKWYKANKFYRPDYVIFGSFFKAIGETTIGKMLDRYCEIANIDRIKVHEFRHSHASDCINRLRMDRFDLAERLGHSDTNQIERIYGHLYPTTKKDSIKGM